MKTQIIQHKKSNKKKPNNLSLYDMLGNVWEWTNSLSDQGNSARVIRGGSWGSGARGFRSAYRFNLAPGFRDNHVGFRLLRTLKTCPSNPITVDNKAEQALAIARKALKEIEELLK